MSVDPRTVVLVAAAFQLVVVALLAGLRRLRPGQPGLDAWLGSQVAILLAAALTAARDDLPFLVAPAGSNLLIVASDALMLEGLVRFHALPRRLPRVLDIAVLATVPALHLALRDPPSNVRLGLTELAGAWFLVRAGLEPLLSAGARRSRAQGVVSAVLLAGAAMGASRALLFLVGPPIETRFVQGAPLVFIALALMFVNVAASAGFLYLGFDRVESELRSALSEVNALSRLLPICASCKKVRDDGGYWRQIESYLSSHSGIAFTHGFCPDCMAKLYPEGG